MRCNPPCNLRFHAHGLRTGSAHARFPANLPCEPLLAKLPRGWVSMATSMATVALATSVSVRTGCVPVPCVPPFRCYIGCYRRVVTRPVTWVSGGNHAGNHPSGNHRFRWLPEWIPADWLPPFPCHARCHAMPCMSGIISAGMAPSGIWMPGESRRMKDSSQRTRASASFSFLFAVARDFVA